MIRLTTLVVVKKMSSLEAMRLSLGRLSVCRRLPLMGDLTSTVSAEKARL